MEQYIPKSTLVAEIERLESRFQNGSDEDYADGYHYSLKLVKRILDTIEVKEVDLEKELDKFYGMYRKDGQTFSLEDNEECVDWKFDCNPNFVKAFAKHFYSLGLKTQKGEDV